MNKFWKVAILICLGDFLLLGLAFTNEAFMFIGIAAMVFELAAGLIMCLIKEHRTMGAGILAGFGMFLVIGFSACSLMLSGIGNMH